MYLFFNRVDILLSQKVLCFRLLPITLLGLLN